MDTSSEQKPEAVSQSETVKDKAESQGETHVEAMLCSPLPRCKIQSLLKYSQLELPVSLLVALC
jgi:hypothetical protein